MAERKRMAQGEGTKEENRRMGELANYFSGSPVLRFALLSRLARTW